MSALTFLLSKLNTMQKRSSNFESAEAMVWWQWCIEAPSTLIRFQTKTELFYSVFKKICVHTYRFRIVFARPHYDADQERSHMVMSVRHFGYSRSSGPAPGRVYFDDFHLQIASFSPSTLENSVFKRQRSQIAPVWPLWRAFLNGSVFGDRFRRCSVDDSRICFRLKMD